MTPFRVKTEMNYLPVNRQSLFLCDHYQGEWSEMSQFVHILQVSRDARLNVLGKPLEC